MTIDEFMRKHFVFDALQANENRDILYSRMKADLEEMMGKHPQGPLCDCPCEPYKIYGNWLKVKDGKLFCGRTQKEPNPLAHGEMLAGAKLYVDVLKGV